jgi:membrane-associated protease RseP (regulator of RpoE activity)
MRNEEVKPAELENGIPALLRELKHVEAPNDFDFRVKARIAAGRPEERSSFKLPVLVRYVAPLALVLLVGGYFGLNVIYTPTNMDVPAVVDTAKVAPPQVSQPAPVIAPAAETTTTSSEIASAKVDLPSNTAVVPIKKTTRSDRTGGGSVDSAVREDRRITSRDISAGEVVTRLGVQGTFDASGFKIDSAAANGLATKAGVKAGDIIEAVNDQPLTEKSSFKGKFTGKSIRVRRDGKTIDLVLKN